MPRWKALPEELDPQVREFAGQLRGLVDRSGLSPAAVADRTGYSKTSWERYLNGRLLAPRGAIVALAEATGTPQHHLSTMWELAERAWSRSEMRHDMTMEAIRISQARAALGEAGVPAAPVAGRHAGGGASVSTVEAPGGEAPDTGRRPSVPVRRGTVPRIPQQPGPASASDSGGSGTPGSGTPTGGAPGEGSGRRRLTLFLAGTVGALLLTAGAVLIVDPGGDDGAGAVAAAPSAGPASRASRLPAGVGCSGADCTGQDPEAMGCGGRFADTVARATVGGGLVEVRWSKTCGATWARLTQASPGDTVRITSGSSGQDGAVDADAEAYTPMVAVEKASDAKACATLASGATGCTTPE
ncbi:XRE family transcriptional regulator [Streptomyces sp. SM10]|uniref:helix-turn-helix domain-containing protein n=1 Tax=Streptomyces sp. SM10 TaxID=565556 RepID=UPI000CDACB81|nr:XRE family transcriptional regulator [Streptomyces sp. SM10]